jgi:hypothetical protein
LLGLSFVFILNSFVLILSTSPPDLRSKIKDQRQRGLCRIVRIIFCLHS